VTGGMNANRTRTRPDLTAIIALASQHLTLKNDVRRTHGQAAHSLVVTSVGQLCVYDAAGQEIWAEKSISDDQLFAIAQAAAALHGFGHWLLDDPSDTPTCGEWRVIPPPHILNLPW